MANHSDASRKAQVLRYLQDRHDQWVDGIELATQKVGGSEGLKRVRELRSEGHRVQTRPHPDKDRSIFQYRLVTTESKDRLAPVVQEMWEATLAPSEPAQELPSPAPIPRPPPGERLPLQRLPSMPMRRNEETGEIELTFEVCVECGTPYTDDADHRMNDAKHLRWLEQQRIMVREHMNDPDTPAEQARVDIPPQPQAYKYTELPTKISMDTSMVCPRCQGYRRSARKSRKQDTLGEMQEAETFTRDPFKPTVKGEPNLCPRCNGFGLVPVFVEHD